MPTSYKGGRGQKERQQVPVPIPVSLAAPLRVHVVIGPAMRLC